MRQRDLGRLVALADELRGARRARLRRGARTALRRRRQVAPRGSSADAARREGARVRRRLRGARRGAGAPRAAGEDRGGRDRGAAPALRRPHPCAAAPLGDVGGRPSPFLAELGVAARRRRAAAAPEPDDPVYAALKRWRLERSKADAVPAYVVFHNSTLAEVAARRPKSLNELASVPGVGPAKLERYGEDVLAALSARVAAARTLLQSAGGLRSRVPRHVGVDADASPCADGAPRSPGRRAPARRLRRGHAAAAAEVVRRPHRAARDLHHALPRRSLPRPARGC